MLAGGTDNLYRNLLAAGHRLYSKVEVLDGDQNLLTIPDEFTDENGGLVYASGYVSASLNSRVTRNLVLTVPEGVYPALATGLLAPYGNRFRVTRGIEMGDGNTKYSWTVFTGRIGLPLLAPEGLVTVTAADRAYEVVEAGFVVPQNSQVGNSVNAEFVRLISDALDDATFGVSDVFAQTVPQLTWAYDRAAALDEMATAVGAFWYALADGSFVLRRYPWTVAAAPILTLSDGVDGILLASPRRDRDDVFNSITVTGERADGTTPVVAFAEDNNPDSPTYVNGLFGRRHRTVPLQTPQTQGSAQTAANAWLRRSIALQETWTWTQPPDAALELGDVVSLNAYDRTGIIQVVSGFTLPLGLDAMMTVQAHAQVVGALE
jgi:uncharacterized protein DUF5047/putative tail protein